MVADSSNVSADDIRVTMQVECTSGYYNGLLYAFVYPEGAEVEEEYAAYFTSPFFISKGDTVTAHFSGRMESAVVGGKYWLKIYYRGEDGRPTAIPSDNNKAHFTIGLPTSVESVESTTGPHDIEVYTPEGVCVLRQKAPRADLSALQPGLYIVKENGKSRKVVK